VLKNQFIRLRTLGQEAFSVTLPQVKIAYNRYNRYCCSSMVTSGSLTAREPIRLPACYLNSSSCSSNRR